MDVADESSKLIDALRGIAGRGHVLTTARRTRRYSQGYRFGGGPVLAVVRPAGLVEMWRVVQACVTADVIVIVQAANTGLTGGSTPDGRYDRPVVIVSTTRLDRLHLIDGGRQVICLPGATLHQLERRLARTDREPHSVIGSSCFGASVVGGVCNNSGGALVKRGPAYTEYALYARIDVGGTIELVDQLGVRLGEDAETILGRLDRGDFGDGDVVHDPVRTASDKGYAAHVRDVTADTPARFNADARRLSGASGSAGRVIVFAVRLDTFARELATSTFYIGTNDPDELATLRHRLLAPECPLPIAAEYIHRDAFDIAARYGKDSFLAIKRLGTDRLPMLYAVKARFDTLAARLGLKSSTSDRLMQAFGRLLPDHLPPRMRAFRDNYEHHLLLKVGADAQASTRVLLEDVFPSAAGAMFECTETEAADAFLHRFVTAGAAVRYRTIHPDAVADIVALDIALPRNARTWFETLPADLDAAILHKLYYGHFLCHVLHQDYVVAKGHDPIAIEHRMWELLDLRGAEYPAEHNVGHLYPAKPPLADFYRSLDPTNRLNPGIGATSRRRDWA
ncbi:D-lactate dehydrogenase [Sphingomonas montana]|uniref:D-lactate dehydrogenase n=1 Tax=Sphingomonas montana TaxID=1843236 RepID=UPI00096C9B4C|nr:D-lactate dehydrogenase [Sphingomonas montana]